MYFPANGKTAGEAEGIVEVGDVGGVERGGNSSV
jgi:hypothetical protein